MSVTSRTPLQCASYGGFLNCVTVLLESGADPNARDSEVQKCMIL